MKRTIPITLPDYQRAFQIMHGILKNEESTPHKACLFFANAGATILRNHFKLPAVPIAGAAFYLLEESNKSVLSFANLDEMNGYSSTNAFHAWVLCGDWVIDFMAPLFPEAMKEIGIPSGIPRKMFQRKLDSMVHSLDDFNKSGDYFLQPNIELTTELQQGLIVKPANKDLWDISSMWFKKNPKKIQGKIPISNEKGNLSYAKLSNLSLTGAW